MVSPLRISPDWAGEPCIVAAPGPSLTAEVVRKVRMARWLKQWRVIAVQDAYRVMPFADAMYGCDHRWWDVHKGAVEFGGERWTSHEDGEDSGNDKTEIAARYGLRCVRGAEAAGFSTDPSVIHYGANSGFQAVNLAMHKGASRIVLVGFDMRAVGDKTHFFGDHPAPLHNRTDYRLFIERFREAAKTCRTPIINCTPGSALDAFPAMDLDAALHDCLPGHRPESDARARAGCA